MKSLISKLLLLSCILGLTLTSCEDSNKRKKNSRKKRSGYSYNHYNAKCKKCSNKTRQRYSITRQSMGKIGKTSRRNTNIGTR